MDQVKPWYVVLFVAALAAMLLGMVMLNNSRVAACAELGGNLASNGSTCLSNDGQILDVF